MTKDAYKDVFQGWIAKAGEYKMAISIAAACTVIVLVSLVWPKPKPAPTISGISATPPASHPFSSPPPAPAAPEPKPAAPAPAPATPAPSPMQQELAAKPLFPPAPKTEPKPAPAAPAPPPPAPAPAPKPSAAPPAPKPAAPASAQSLPAGYYVQVGSFQDEQHAIALAAKVEDKHWQSRIAARPGGLHAVWVGPYPTRDAVDKAKQALKKDTGLPGFVVKFP
jgi:hypothetical protein